MVMNVGGIFYKVWAGVKTDVVDPCMYYDENL